MSSRRIERCYTDNIYLIESIQPEPDYPYERQYLIMGNSGNTYTVTISNQPTCTCPDHTTRGNRCKHIYFVLIRIMNTYNYTEKTFSDEELEEMFLNIPQVAKNLMYQGDEPQEQKEVKQKFEKGDVCPICLDPLENGKELDYCKYSCGQTIHKKCFSMWEKSKGGICVFCRGKWYSNFSSKPKPVSMHPIDYSIQIEEKEEEVKEIVKDNDSKNEKESSDDKIDIEEESYDSISEMLKKRKEKDKKNKKRKKSRGRSRDKSRSSDMNLSRSVSRSRSRDKIKEKSRNKNRKKVKYPKK